MRINVILLNLTMREGSKGIGHRVLRESRLFVVETESVSRGRKREREGRERVGVTDYVNPVNSSC